MNEYSAIVDTLVTSKENESKKIFNDWMMLLAGKSDEEGFEGFVGFINDFTLKSKKEQNKIAGLVAGYLLLIQDDSQMRLGRLFKEALSSTSREIQNRYFAQLSIKILEEVTREKKHAKEKYKRIAEFVASPDVRAVFQELYTKEEEHETYLKKKLNGFKLINEF
jgi:bacterioferritin (cytochrome b1)